MSNPLRVSPTFSDLHPAGNFQAVISNIEEAEGLHGKQFKFVINTDATFKELGYALFHFTSQSFSARSKLGLLIHSVLGKRSNDYRGQELDLQELIDHLFMVTIEHQIKNQKERAVIVGHSPYHDKRSTDDSVTGTGGEMS